MKNDGSVKPKPQEFANTLWAFATAGIRVDAYVKLTKLMADTMEECSGKFFDGHFKPQELANSGEERKCAVTVFKTYIIVFSHLNSYQPLTAWALATLHSKRTNGGNDSLIEMNAVEDDSIVRILRWVAINIQQQVDNFKPQELSNSVWAFATIGFGYDESSGLNVHNDYTYIASDAPLKDKSLVFDTLEIVAENAKQRLERFKVRFKFQNLVMKII